MDNELLLDEISAGVDIIKQEHGTSIKQIQEELKELKAKGGRARLDTPGELSTKEIIRQSFIEKGADIANHIATSERIGYKFQLKDAGVMTASNNLTGNTQATYAASAEVRPRRQLHFRDLVNVYPSATGVWKYYRSKTPAGEGSFGFQTVHGESKNQLDYDIEEITILAEYLAGFAVISKQMISDLPFMANFLSNELTEDYLRRESHEFFGDLYSAATGTAPTSGLNTAEKIIDAIAALSEKDFNPNVVVTTNATWAAILKTNLGSGAGYGVPGGITISPSGDVLIAGVPILRTSETNIGAGKFLVGDWNKVAIIQQEGLNIAMSEHDDQNFRKNLITVRAESKLGLAILNPAAFVYGNA